MPAALGSRGLYLAKPTFSQVCPVFRDKPFKVSSVATIALSYCLPFLLLPFLLLLTSVENSECHLLADSTTLQAAAPDTHRLSDDHTVSQQEPIQCLGSLSRRFTATEAQPWLHGVPTELSYCFHGSVGCESAQAEVTRDI